MKTLSRNLPTAAAVAAALLLTAAVSAQGLPYRESVRESFPLGPGGVFSLDNVNGAATIEAWDGHQVEVEAEKFSDSRACLDALRLEFDASVGRVFVKAHFPDSRCRQDDSRGQTKVDFAVRLPRHAALDGVSLVNGSLTVTGVAGGVAGSSVNGRVLARAVSGPVRLSTVNGTVEAELTNLGSGDRVELHSVNGAVRLALPPAADVRVQARTTNGSIRNDLGLPVTKGRFVGSHMEGILGSGAGEVSLRTVNGSIALTTL